MANFGGFGVPYTVYREIFVLKNFRVLNFRGLGSTTKFFNTFENGHVRVPAAVVRERVPHLQGRVGSRRR